MLTVHHVYVSLPHVSWSLTIQSVNSSFCTRLNLLFSSRSFLTFPSAWGKWWPFCCLILPKMSLSSRWRLFFWLVLKELFNLNGRSNMKQNSSLILSLLASNVAEGCCELLVFWLKLWHLEWYFLFVHESFSYVQTHEKWNFPSCSCRYKYLHSFSK